MIYPTPYSGSSFNNLRIGLLGGSFNPAHDGHLAMSLYAMKRLKLDQVWWLVSPQNPLKSHKNMLSLKVRVEQAKLLASKHSRLCVTAIEAQLGTRYTIDTIQALKKHYPQTRFVWLMGADNMRQMSRWRQWEQLFREVPIAVFRRPLYAAGRGCGKAAHRVAAAWQPEGLVGKLADQKAPAWVVLNNKHSTLSATSLRQKKSKPSTAKGN